MTLMEATTQRIDRFLQSVPVPSGQRTSRVVLNMAFGMASRFDAIPVNPVIDAYRPPRSKPSPRALTVRDVNEIRRRVANWQGEQRLGPPRGHDMLEIIEVFLGTGLRIGEVLALRWQDVSGLDSESPALTVEGTVVEPDRGPCERQAYPKTEGSRRTLLLPTFAVAALQRQRARGIPSIEGLIFPTRTGSPRRPSNFRKNWRDIRGDDYAWVKPHSFRKTVATEVKRSHGLSAASEVLGHSGVAVTERAYVERVSTAPDVRDALTKFEPGE